MGLQIKYKANGDVEKIKTRHVANDHTQIEGFDYIDTFSLISKIVFVRALLVVASIKDWIIYHVIA